MCERSVAALAEAWLGRVCLPSPPSRTASSPLNNANHCRQALRERERDVCLYFRRVGRVIGGRLTWLVHACLIPSLSEVRLYQRPRVGAGVVSQVLSLSPIHCLYTMTQHARQAAPRYAALLSIIITQHHSLACLRTSLDLAGPAGAYSYPMWSPPHLPGPPWTRWRVHVVPPPPCLPAHR